MHGKRKFRFRPEISPEFCCPERLNSQPGVCRIAFNDKNFDVPGDAIADAFV